MNIQKNDNIFAECLWRNGCEYESGLTRGAARPAREGRSHRDDRQEEMEGHIHCLLYGECTRKLFQKKSKPKMKPLNWNSLNNNLETPETEFWKHFKIEIALENFGNQHFIFFLLCSSLEILFKKKIWKHYWVIVIFSMRFNLFQLDIGTKLTYQITESNKANLLPLKSEVVPKMRFKFTDIVAITTILEEQKGKMSEYRNILKK